MLDLIVFFSVKKSFHLLRQVVNLMRKSPLKSLDKGPNFLVTLAGISCEELAILRQFETGKGKKQG